MSAPESAFQRDTRVVPVGDGRFTGQVTERWNGISGQPLGGYVLAMALRALRAQMPVPDPLVVAAFFLERVSPGPVELHTHVVRSGKRTATGGVSVFHNGSEAMRVFATFADLDRLTGPVAVFAAPPTLPSPEESVPLYDDPRQHGGTVAEQVDFRVARMPGWRMGMPSGRPSAEFWLRLTGGGDGDPLTLPFLVDCAAPAVVELGAIGTITLQLTIHLYRRPAPGWLACRATTTFLLDGHHEEDFEVWDRDGLMVAQSRQLALIRQPAR